MYAFTLLSSGQDALTTAAQALGLQDLQAMTPRGLRGLRNTPISMTERDALQAQIPVDIICRAANAPSPKLFLADMDATMVVEETIDELAKRAGVGAEVKAITDLAKTGQIDFVQALNKRVALFRGVKEMVLAETAGETTYSPGARQLLAGLKARGIKTVLISGGFTFFTGVVARYLGFDHHIANTFEMVDGTLTGQVLPPIISKRAKAEYLAKFCVQYGFTPTETITIGDGANDIDMLSIAERAGGLGIGYQPKQIVQENVLNLMKFSRLDELLLAL